MTSTVIFASLSATSGSRMRAASEGSAVAMTMCLPTPEFFPASAITPKMPMNTSGMRMVVTLNALPLTCSRYSRFAISKMSRIDFFSHRADENLFERRLHQLESRNRRLADGLAQQVLRIRARLQLNLGLTRIVLVTGYRRMPQERSVTLKIHHHMIALIARLHFAHASLQHGLPAVDEADGVAEFLHLVHAMRREQDRLA